MMCLYTITNFKAAAEAPVWVRLAFVFLRGSQSAKCPKPGCGKAADGRGMQNTGLGG
jgi:hypothetical protein